MNGGRRTVSQFEIVMFTLTRVFALIGTFATIVALVVLVLHLTAPPPSTSVTFSEVTSRMVSVGTTGSAGRRGGTQGGASPEVPADLRPYLGGDNEPVLRGWLTELTREQRREFLGNMSQIVREAKARNVDVTDAINTYKTLKLKKLNASAIDNYAAAATRAGYVAGVVALLLVLSVLSLVLVLLAIERNTRPVV